MNLLLDTHTHTVASGHAYSTIMENAKMASEKGLKLICMTDHGPKMPGGPHMFHFGNLKVMPREIFGVEILRGVEANIIDRDGSLDVPDEILKKLDVVIASLHDVCFPYRDVESNTEAIINAMKNPYVDVIGHPGNPLFEIDIDKVIEAALEHDTCIEINNSSFVSSRVGSYDNCLLIAKKASMKNVKICVGSDAHISFDVGRFDKALEVIESANIEEENILNTDVGKFKEYLRLKGKLRN
ncbi:MAG: phosphatase [Thermoanaerobacterium sp.]|nr:phosphatase [Thermoanaerobacterium sp.]